MALSSPFEHAQTTLAFTLMYQGIGLHTGKEISLTLHPAPAESGIIFSRSDIDKEKKFRLTAHNIHRTNFNTSIAHPDFPEISISTIEHLLSALYAAGIDNLFIEVNGPEIPALDGSAKEFLAPFLKENALKSLNKKKKFIKILREIKIEEENGAWVRLTPLTSSPTQESPQENLFTLHVTIDFPASFIGKQGHFYKISYDTAEKRAASLKEYEETIAPSRTFIDFDSIAPLQQKGLALGGSLSNALVYHHNELLNPNGLYFANEFARHKLLDAIGDLYCQNYGLIGHFEGYKSGHHLNNQILQKLLSKKENWCLM